MNFKKIADTSFKFDCVFTGLIEFDCVFIGLIIAYRITNGLEFYHFHFLFN